MPNSRKKVIVRTHANTLHPGYLPLTGILDGATVPLFDLDARVVPIPLTTVRWIAYVRDFNLTDILDPERLTRRTFLARPRTEGLWLRLALTSPENPAGEVLEGLAPIDLSLVDSLLDDRGLYLIPPDIRSNTQRLYLPRTSFSDVQLIAVITTPSKARPASADDRQDRLFRD